MYPLYGKIASGYISIQHGKGFGSYKTSIFIRYLTHLGHSFLLAMGLGQVSF